MTIPPPEAIDLTAQGPDTDAALEALRDRPAVFVVHTTGPDPYIARTALLRRRLLRLLARRDQPSRLLNLRSIATLIEYWPVASHLESSLLHYELARRHFPETYLALIKLKMPAYVKLVLSNAFPRAQVTSRLSGGRGFWFGPFRTRTGAEEFQSQCMDLFQMRRCQEDLSPSAGHPGCIYGEMNMCLRPCQLIVGIEEYASEVNRVAEFLTTAGKVALESTAAARERLSAELQFEEAARQHARYERIEGVLKLRDELVTDINQLDGVCVTRSTECGCVDLRFVGRGCWRPSIAFRIAPEAGSMIPMERRLREHVAALPEVSLGPRDRQEHIALLARWYYSSWRDGVWLPYEGGHPPYRKLVRAISRVATEAQSAC